MLVLTVCVCMCLDVCLCVKVFGTDVMVTVARSFDAPIKLLFPQWAMVGAKANPSMLGLGDIVIPGIFIALLLRFDYQQHENRHKAAASAALVAAQSGKAVVAADPSASTPVSTPYFYSALVAYWAGLSTTVAVMYFFEAAQPALLYLVPACLGGAILTAATRGEAKTLFHFAEGQAKEEQDAKKAIEAKKDK